MKNVKNEVAVVGTVQQKPMQYKTRLAQAVAVGTTYAMATHANAAGQLDAIGQSLGTEIDGAKAIVLTLLASAALVLAIFIGWKFLKKGASAA